MSRYRETQRGRAIGLRERLFRDPGDGLYKRLPREFVLSEPALNLWSGIREDALEYYRSNTISWWDSGAEPTGHLLSSQIACLNHLYFLRQREDLATAILKALDPTLTRALKIDSGFVEFEKVGCERLGGERHLTRGANCTSIDALMLGENALGARILVLIEWKYTESYAADNKLAGDSGRRRLEAYESLLADPNSPLAVTDWKALFYEPFYQLMRQTLLAWQMTRRKEYGAEAWLHVHIVPRANLDLRESITSPGLVGLDISDAWQRVLKQPERFCTVDPEDFLRPTLEGPDTRAVTTYLRDRYWDSSEL